MNCPNCSGEMDHVVLDGVYGPGVEIDLCFPCHVLWLDKRESYHLTPRGTLDLFKVLSDHREDPRHSLENGNRCPRCGRRLSLSHDIGKAGRFTYYSCPADDGRLTPFSEFLKEKQFVRSLTPAEQERIRAEIRTAQCSGCGAPVDLAGAFRCEHCQSPITVLDPNAVEDTLRRLQDADRRRNEVDPHDRELEARALASMEAMRTDPEEQYSWGRAPLQPGRSIGSLGVDLLSASLGLIFGDL
jgi:Zn-finger nucleic acid-binding protein